MNQTHDHISAIAEAVAAMLIADLIKAIVNVCLH